MLTPQIGAIGPLANAALTSSDALWALLQEPSFSPDTADTASFWDVLPKLEEKLASAGHQTDALKRHLTARAPEALLDVALDLSEVLPDHHRIAANAVMLSGGLFFDHSLPLSETVRTLCAQHAPADPRVDTQYLLKMALTQQLRMEGGGDALLAENRACLLSLYPAFFSGEDEALHSNAALLRQEIAAYLENALMEEVICESVEEETDFDVNFIEKVSLSPDSYIWVGAEKLVPDDFVALTADMAGFYFQREFYFMSAYLCQAAWDEMVPVFEPHDPDLQNLFLFLAQSYYALGYYTQSLDYFEKTLCIETEGKIGNTQAAQWIMERIVSIYLLLGRYEEAEEMLEILLTPADLFHDETDGGRESLLRQLEFAKEALR